MNYEIERKLNEKADRWELQNLQNENNRLKNDIKEIERNIEELKSVNSMQRDAFSRLLSYLAENPAFEDLQNEIYELRNYC